MSPGVKNKAGHFHHWDCLTGVCTGPATRTGMIGMRLTAGLSGVLRRWRARGCQCWSRQSGIQTFLWHSSRRRGCGRNSVLHGSNLPGMMAHAIYLGSQSREWRHTLFDRVPVRDGLTNGPMSSGGPWAQGAPKPELLREVAAMYLLFVVEKGVFY